VQDVAALCRQALRSDTKFFLQLFGSSAINYFKRADLSDMQSGQNTSQTWTASITGVLPSLVSFHSFT
jgi:hypothetical protein